jgi:hypothetical protein
MLHRRLACFLIVVFSAASMLIMHPASASLFGDRKPDEFEAEQFMFRLINKKRTHLNHPEVALQLDRQTRRDARDNSDSMAADDQFERPFTTAPGACATVGSREETDYKTAMRSIFRAWLANRDTRRCVLARADRFGGVGVTRGDNFTYWVTFIGSTGPNPG